MKRGSRLAALTLLALPGLVGAQVRPAPPPGQMPARPSPPALDSAGRDTTGRDTTAQWSPADSIMQKLLAKPGYTVTRYEGETVTFDVVSKALAIAAAAARKAIVERDSMRARTDSVIGYDQRTNTVNVSGHFNIVPGSGQAPIQGSGTARYDLGRRAGRLTNARTTVDESGERWFIDSEISIPVMGDSARGIPPRFYGLGGSLTSCDDSIPDYHFRLREIKRTEKTLVARPAVLYISDIPVMWLPFVFQDIRPGRRSGILPPGFGAADIVRNNPNYRRYIENVGYYWAISDYVDFATWMDWRSSAGADSTDPGWVKINGEWKYNWLSRFLSGRLASGYMRQRDGQNNLSIAWSHQQRLSPDRNFNANVNYTTSTVLQRRNTFLPAQAIATIVSTLAFSDKLGPAAVQIGGNLRQFPGRKQIERAAPSFSITGAAFSRGDWLLWNPSFSFNETATLHIDQPGTFSTRFVPDANGQVVRVDSLDRNQYIRTMTIGSPLKLFGLDFSQAINIRDELSDFPVEAPVYPGADSARREMRVFPRVYRTQIDWNPSFSLPPLFQNRFKLTPSISLSNVDPGPYWVRSVTSGGKFVHQSKRLAYGLSAAPTIFGLWPGFGPFARFRHSISPSLSYAYAPPAKVSDEYLEAINQSKQVYLGFLAQNAVSFSLSQNIEAKVMPSRDTSAGAGMKLKVLSMTFTPLSYDFERARKTGRRLSGVTTESFGSTITSDLLPGMSASVNYSLFEGSTMTDTAVFKPYLTTVSSRLSLSQNENPLAIMTRLFGKAVPVRSPPVTTGMLPVEANLAREFATQPVAGQAARGRQYIAPPTQGWQVNINFSSSRSRPVRGDRVIEVDPRVRCEFLKVQNPFLYDECLRTPISDEMITPGIAGAPIFRTPRQTSTTGDLRFALTQKWSATWTSTYDFELDQFASQMVSLQRDLHDWRAIFAFTHSPNGNFAFNFFIALKPQPDLKFDYNRATVRSR